MSEQTNNTPEAAKASAPTQEELALTDRLLVAIGQRTTAQNALLERVAVALERLAAQVDLQPIRRKLSEYIDFDFSSIGADVLAKDEDGPTVILMYGKEYRRRAPENQYGAAIWYSRCIGKDEGGKNKYEVALEFSIPFVSDIEPLGPKTLAQLTKYANQKKRKGAA